MAEVSVLAMSFKKPFHLVASNDNRVELGKCSRL